MNTFPISHYEAMKSSELKYLFTEIFPKLSENLDPKTCTFDEFAKFFEIEFSKMTSNMYVSMGITSPKVQTDSFNLIARMAWHPWTMNAYGGKIFYVAKNLWTKLEQTNLTINIETFRAPYPSVYIILEDCDIRMKDYKDVGNVSGFYFQLENIHDSVMYMRIMACGKPHLISTGCDLNFYWTFRFDKLKEDVEDAIDRNVTSLGEKFKINNPSDFTDDNVSLMSRLTKMAANLMLYLTSKSPDIVDTKPEVIPVEGKKNPAKKAKAENLKARSMQIPFIYVGRNVTKVECLSSPSGKTWSLSEQIWVRGHWRQQWMGSTSDGTKHQEGVWIEPYKKGPDVAELINKKYVVKE